MAPRKIEDIAHDFFLLAGGGGRDKHHGRWRIESFM